MTESIDSLNNGVRQSYFFLSYAHSLPPTGSQVASPDGHVHVFYGDLSRAVTRHAGKSHVTAGYFDQELSIGLGGRKAALERAIGSAEVFVPLYSPSYIARSWPGREWACFEQRMRAAGIADPSRRFTPVLWVPLPPGQRPHGLREAEDLAPTAAVSAYTENGLRALMRLAPYRYLYELVVDRLAEIIVRTAEAAPIGPSPVPDISQLQSAFTPPADAAIFVIAVAAPALHEAAVGSNRLAYGASGTAWQPFAPEQELSLADYVAMAAEQLDFIIQMTDITLLGEVFSHAPGILLIDPWYIAESPGLDVIRQAISGLPSWVLPVLVTDLRGDNRAAQWTEDIRRLFGPARSESTRQALDGVDSLSAFTTLIPFLVAEAERDYVWHGPSQRATAVSPHFHATKPAIAVSGIRAAGTLENTPGHAFISYVREDSAKVAQLEELLQAAGIPVWRDTANLWPGEDWRRKIRHAITEDALAFLACFSHNSLARDKTYMNEELALAIEQLRQRRPEDPWLIPIRLDDCDIPDRDIGNRLTLQSYQRADLFGDHYDENAMRLVAAIKRILTKA